MKHLIEEAKQSFINQQLPPKEESFGIVAWINGIRTDWNWKEKAITIGYRNSTEDLENIKNHLEFSGIMCKKRGAWLEVDPSISNFDSVIESLLNITIDLERPQGDVEKRVKGVLFEGSNFSNAHERTTTIGPRFLKMPCSAAGMNVLQMDSEWKLKDGGRADAIEIDEKGNGISLYECQSGIQNGDFLDDVHLYKALMRYPADPVLAPTLKKIVILAGGYSKDHLRIIKWQAENLKIDRGIEVILLKTTRTEDKIGVVKVDYQNC